MLIRARNPIYFGPLQNGYQTLCHPSDGDNINVTNIYQSVLSVELPTSRDVFHLSLKFGVRIM